MFTWVPKQMDALKRHAVEACLGESRVENPAPSSL